MTGCTSADRATRTVNHTTSTMAFLLGEPNPATHTTTEFIAAASPAFAKSKAIAETITSSVVIATKTPNLLPSATHFWKTRGLLLWLLLSGAVAPNGAQISSVLCFSLPRNNQTIAHLDFLVLREVETAKSLCMLETATLTTSAGNWRLLHNSLMETLEFMLDQATICPPQSRRKSTKSRRKMKGEYTPHNIESQYNF